MYYLTSTLVDGVVLVNGDGKQPRTAFALTAANDPSAGMMFFSIEPSNGVAIYDQIVRQVKFAIAEGTLRPGQLLPSVRVLSQQLAINPNTIQRAYQQLQSDGVLESLRGRGLAVGAEATQRCVAERRELIGLRLRSALTEALHAGFSASEVRRIVNEQLLELNGNVPSVSSTNPESAPLTDANS